MTIRSYSQPRDRHEAIIRLIRDRGRMSVEELADELDASRETIRRDLNLLSGNGTLRKYHGGAMALVPEVEGSFKNRLTQEVAAKRRIARRARELFAPGDTLFIDTGSTTLFLAQELQRAPRLSIVTNSAAIAHALTRQGSEHQVFLLGGEYRNDNQETAGSLAIAQIRGFRMRHAVLTIGALGLDGAVMDYSFEEAEIARAMIAQAASVTILADLSKLGRHAAYEVCRFSAVHRIIVDERPSLEFLSLARDTDTDLLIADE